MFSELNLEHSLDVPLASPWAVNSLTVLIKLRNYIVCAAHPFDLPCWNAL